MTTNIPILKHRHYFESLTFYIVTNNSDIVLKFTPDTHGYMSTLRKHRDLQRSRSPQLMPTCFQFDTSEFVTTSILFSQSIVLWTTSSYSITAALRPTVCYQCLGLQGKWITTSVLSFLTEHLRDWNLLERFLHL